MKNFATLSAFLGFLTLANSSPLPTADVSAANILIDRQYGACAIWSASTEPAGGDSSQQYLHKQLSQTITCAQDAGCSVGESESQSFTIGWSLTSGSEVTEWISAGFSVSETWTTGNSYTCNGAASDTVCIWQKIAHTRYNVQNGAYNSCTGFSPSGDQSTITSPNNNNAGGGYYCVVGTCRNQGDEYWE